MYDINCDYDYAILVSDTPSALVPILGLKCQEVVLQVFWP